MKNIVIRASSLGRLFDCPASWAAVHLEGKRTSTNGRAALGHAVHASTAVFDLSVINGDGITIDESAAAAVDVIHNPEEEVLWEEGSPTAAEKIAISLHKKYCEIIAPHQNYLAVEIKCDGLTIADLGITLTGTTDRVRETSDGEVSICDIKTGKAAVNTDGIVRTSGHAYQMGVYELLAEHASGLRITAPAQIIGMNTAETSDAQRIGTGEISGARQILLGDGESPGVLEYASKLINSGLFWGNPKSMMCHERYCPIFKSCRFRK